VIRHSGKAEVSTGRKDRAGEQIGSVDAARDIRGAKTGLARLREIARLDLGFAEIAKQFRLEGIVAGALQGKRPEGVTQMNRGFLIGELFSR
jgi:hypothetical protein